MVATVVLIVAHAASALLFTWIGGEEIRFEPGAEVDIDSGGDASDGGGSGGDGSSSV